MRKAVFFVGYGLLPLWGSIAVVLVGSLLSRSSEYWAVAPWLVIASIPYCAATTIAATTTLVIHATVPGDASRKKKIATNTFWAFNAFFVAVVSVWWLRSVERERELANEEAAVQDFVRSHSSIVQQFGINVEASVASYTVDSRSLPLKYDIAIGTKRSAGKNLGSQHVFAVVSVKSDSGQRQFVLDCITPLSVRERDPFKDPCQQ